MSVQRNLQRVRGILLNLAEAPNCVQICGYSGEQVKWFAEDLDRVLKRYKSEAKRVRKYYP